jgi:antitoxin (DNA-binding transcriptional repressor) of toxin-antitoxin stability system
MATSVMVPSSCRAVLKPLNAHIYTAASADTNFGFCELLPRFRSGIVDHMKTLTVQEASQSLGHWLRRALSGEQIAIQEGKCTVLLQPLAESHDTAPDEGLSAREALRRLQSNSRLSAAKAEDYVREIRAERQTDRKRNSQ